MATSSSPLSITASRTLQAVRAALRRFLLPLANTLAPIQSMLPIYPLSDGAPDASTFAAAYYKNAYPGQLYSCPILVAYGRYPFLCTLKSGPAWLSVGEFLVLESDTLTEDGAYMNVSGTPPAGSEGVHTVTVEVKDQSYRGASPAPAVEISWTLTVGTALWYFVAPSATGAGDGSSPDDCAVPSFAAWDVAAIAPGQGKICVYRGGTYNKTANTDLRPQFHPITHMAYPGEQVTILMNNTAFGYKTSDFMLVGLTLSGGVSQIITCFERHDRQGLWRCVLDGLQVDTPIVVNRISNQSAWYLNRPEGMRKYAFIRECTFSGYKDVAFYDWYSTAYSLVERNLVLDAAGNTTDQNVYFPKSECEYHSVRRNVALIPNTTLTLRQFYHMYFSDAYGVGSGTNADMSYNVLVINPSSNKGEAWFEATTSSSVTAHSRRNTQVGAGFSISQFSDPKLPIKLFVDSNVIQHTQNSAETINKIVYAGAVAGVNSEVINSELHVANGAADVSTGKLVGAARTSWLGKRGFEISGDLS
jgi:hypothetical protein